MGAEIATRATALIGTPFRLHGRNADGGIDCVGVVALSLQNSGCGLSVPCDYAMRGQYREHAFAFFDRNHFQTVTADNHQTGDILLCQPAVRQLHFAIITAAGLVHAHAGLRRVVVTPPPVTWPVIGHWRYIGE